MVAAHPEPDSHPSADEAHHLVRYLQHVRRELRRALEGMAVADLERHLGGMNSVAWMVGHLAWQEQSYWLTGRGEPDASRLDLKAFGRTRPEAMPTFEALFEAWEKVTTAADKWLLALGEPELRTHLTGRRMFDEENVGTLLTRVIGHYYLHIGQITAIRKWLDYPVPPFVGSQAGADYR